MWHGWAPFGKGPRKRTLTAFRRSIVIQKQAGQTPQICKKIVKNSRTGAEPAFRYQDRDHHGLFRQYQQGDQQPDPGNHGNPDGFHCVVLPVAGTPHSCGHRSPCPWLRLSYLLISGKRSTSSRCRLRAAIGMVVDDAIVALENVATHIERGTKPKSAAVMRPARSPFPS